MLSATIEEQAGQPQSMTRIADAVGVTVSGRIDERARVLRTLTEPLESRSAPPAGHGRFPESLLLCQPGLQT
ncbi:hypothetical protein [Kitasatospora sp. NPDC056531]|uniref:hypothetical protein n=1 Tax=Kitasatospora sp. NPDC056531 TaxID=3345856 RepID=UPI0036CCC102